jgi:hypothetical protein
MKFSRKYGTFEGWSEAQVKRTPYTKRIVRLHSFYPKASLTQLRGHARIKTKPLALYRRAWDTLSSKEQLVRERALEVLSLARRSGQSLSRLSRQHNISSRAVLEATRGFRKVKGRWKAKERDRISRIMAINEDGKELFIEVDDSRYASLIGRYQSAVKEYLNSGDASVLAEFKGKRVKDSFGKWHTLETNPQAVREINARIEQPEFREIYKVTE